MCTGIFSGTQYSLNGKGQVDERELMTRSGEADVYILEGLKNSAYPKIEVVRREKSSVPVCDEETLICIATDVVSQEDVKCPVFGMDDVQGIFLCVKKYFGLEI